MKPPERRGGGDKLLQNLRSGSRARRRLIRRRLKAVAGQAKERSSDQFRISKLKKQAEIYFHETTTPEGNIILSGLIAGIVPGRGFKICKIITNS